jgi:hypothetical protein
MPQLIDQIQVYFLENIATNRAVQWAPNLNNVRDNRPRNPASSASQLPASIRCLAAAAACLLERLSTAQSAEGLTHGSGLWLV